VVAERLALTSRKGFDKWLHKTGTAPETTEKKNPQLLSNWDCIICGYFHGLKKWWQKRNYSLTTTHWPLAIKLGFLYFIS
jgi:hypothetical protein